MKSKLSPKVKKFIKEIFYKLTGEYGWARRSWSQEGEDLILSRIFSDLKDGFYIDIGAHHPFRFSNTFLFYKKGWSGIAVDPLPGVKILFNKHRPRDLTLEMGVASSKKYFEYYMFNEPAINTFNKKYAEEIIHDKVYALVEIKHIECIPLSEILDKFLPHNKQIDFMTVDAELKDLEVLQSNCWKKYRPKVIVAESNNPSIFEIKNDPIAIYLGSIGYAPIAKAVNSVIYQDVRKVSEI